MGCRIALKAMPISGEASPPCPMSGYSNRFARTASTSWWTWRFIRPTTACPFSPTSQHPCRLPLRVIPVPPGIRPSTIVSSRPRSQYLELYYQIDIGLDTLPYNGHTTSLDSYWMGVPVITLVGQTVVGRAGFSQLMNLGLPELIAKKPEEYVRLAAELA